MNSIMKYLTVFTALLVVVAVGVSSYAGPSQFNLPLAWILGPDGVSVDLDNNGIIDNAENAERVGGLTAADILAASGGGMGAGVTCSTSETEIMCCTKVDDQLRCTHNSKLGIISTISNTSSFIQHSIDVPPEPLLVTLGASSCGGAWCYSDPFTRLKVCQMAGFSNVVSFVEVTASGARNRWDAVLDDWVSMGHTSFRMNSVTCN